MKTNEDVTRRIDRQGVLGQMGLLSPENVAKICVRQLFRRDTLIMLGWLNKINWLILNLVPVPWKMSLMTRAVRREICGTYFLNVCNIRVSLYAFYGNVV